MSWITSLNRKRHQRVINSFVRKANKNLQDDDLWRGRFYIHQVGPTWRYIYEDGSGMELYVTLECVDRKTGRTWQKMESVNHWTFPNGWRIWDMMNTFIIEKVKVWEENPAPGKEGFYSWML